MMTTEHDTQDRPASSLEHLVRRLRERARFFASDDLVIEAADEIERLCAENSALRVAIDPRLWGEAHHAAWHGELPDTHEAFIALRKVALTPNGGGNAP